MALWNYTKTFKNRHHKVIHVISDSEYAVRVLTKELWQVFKNPEKPTRNIVLISKILELKRKLARSTVNI